MTDANQPAAGTTGGTLAVAVNLQYVKDLSFENPRAPLVFAPNEPPPQVQVNVDVGARHLAESAYEVVLTLNAEAKSGDQAVFVVELTYAGVFTVPALPAEHLRPLLLIECPRLLFPFARSVIANATRDGGFPPLMINPIDFATLYRRQAEAAAQEPAGTA